MSGSNHSPRCNEPIVQRRPNLGGRPDDDLIARLQPSLFTSSTVWRGHLKRGKTDPLTLVLKFIEKVRQPSDDERRRRHVAGDQRPQKIRQAPIPDRLRRGVELCQLAGVARRLGAELQNGGSFGASERSDDDRRACRIVTPLDSSQPGRLPNRMARSLTTSVIRTVAYRADQQYAPSMCRMRRVFL